MATMLKAVLPWEMLLPGCSGKHSHHLRACYLHQWTTICLCAAVNQISGAATSVGQQFVNGVSSGAGDAVSGAESLASTAAATYTTIEGQTIIAQQGNLPAGGPLRPLHSKERVRPAGKSRAEEACLENHMQQRLLSRLRDIMHRLRIPSTTCTHASCAGRPHQAPHSLFDAAELDNINAGVASIPDTLNYLEGYFDDYDYDLEQLFEGCCRGALALHGRPSSTCASSSGGSGWRHSYIIEHLLCNPCLSQKLQILHPSCQFYIAR